MLCPPRAPGSHGPSPGHKDWQCWPPPVGLPGARHPVRGVVWLAHVASWETDLCPLRLGTRSGYQNGSGTAHCLRAGPESPCPSACPVSGIAGSPAAPHPCLLAGARALSPFSPPPPRDSRVQRSRRSQPGPGLASPWFWGQPCALNRHLLPFWAGLPRGPGHTWLAQLRAGFRPIWDLGWGVVAASCPLPACSLWV